MGTGFFLYGPGEHPDRLVSYVIRSLLTGQPAQCSAGGQRRDYFYVKDAARAFVALLRSKISGAVNLGSGASVDVATLARRLGSLAQREDLICLGAKPVADDTPMVVAGQQRLRNELGWSPEFTLEFALAETFEWWRRRLCTIAKA